MRRSFAAWVAAGVIVGLFFSRHQIVETASAQLSCSAQSQATLLSQFSDNAAAQSITPANIRNIICSSLNLNGGTLSGGTLAGTTSNTGTISGGTIAGGDASGENATSTGASAARTLAAHFGDALNVQDFSGIHGDGVTDDTTPIQNALNACASAGGGTVWLGPTRYLIDSANLSIPSNCALKGAFWPGGQRPSANYLSLPYELIVNPSFTIQIGQAASLENVIVKRKGVTTPASTRDAINLVAGFSGTGVTCAGHDCLARNVFVLGFTTCYSTSNFQRPNPSFGRLRRTRMGAGSDRRCPAHSISNSIASLGCK